MNISYIAQIVDSMYDAAIKLEIAKVNNKLEDFNKLKQFILDLQKKLNDELSRGV